jgi:hypothetical protein
MSSPRDLRLERLGDRDGRRPPCLGEVALVGPAVAGAGGTSEFRLAYEALIDAVFTAPGAREWLAGLRRKVAAMLADERPAGPVRASSDAIHARPTALLPGRMLPGGR